MISIHPFHFTFLIYMYNVHFYLKCKISDLKSKPGPPVQEKKKQRITPDILAKQGNNIWYLITRKEKIDILHVHDYNNAIEHGKAIIWYHRLKIKQIMKEIYWNLKPNQL